MYLFCPRGEGCLIDGTADKYCGESVLSHSTKDDESDNKKRVRERAANQ